MPANRFAILDGQVYPVNTYAGYYALQEELRRRGLKEIELCHGTLESHKRYGVYVPAY